MCEGLFANPTSSLLYCENISDSFVSKIDAEGPLKQIKQLYNNTHAKAVFDRGLVKIRSNY
jgi:hypothetical protein